MWAGTSVIVASAVVQRSIKPRVLEVIPDPFPVDAPA